MERFGAAALASQVGSTRSEEEPRGESEDAHVARHERERDTSTLVILHVILNSYSSNRLLYFFMFYSHFLTFCRHRE